MSNHTGRVTGARRRQAGGSFTVTRSALAPAALPGGYANLLGPDATDQIAHAYGPNTERLLAVKARFDPDRVFDATPLPERTT